MSDPWLRNRVGSVAAASVPSGPVRGCPSATSLQRSANVVNPWCQYLGNQAGRPSARECFSGVDGNGDWEHDELRNSSNGGYTCESGSGGSYDNVHVVASAECVPYFFKFALNLCKTGKPNDDEIRCTRRFADVAGIKTLLHFTSAELKQVQEMINCGTDVQHWCDDHL